jgi:hypothetical protein
MNVLLAASQGNDWSAVAILAVFCTFVAVMAWISSRRR